MKTIYRKLCCYFFGHSWARSFRRSKSAGIDGKVYYCLDCGYRSLRRPPVLPTLKEDTVYTLYTP